MVVGKNIRVRILKILNVAYNHKRKQLIKNNENDNNAQST